MRPVLVGGRRRALALGATILAACFSPAAPDEGEAPPVVAGGGGAGGGGFAEGGGAGGEVEPRRVCTSDADRDCALVQSVDAGGTFTCVQLDDGSARCLGNNDSGQLGDASQPIAFFGVGASSLPSVATELALGHSHGCSLDAQVSRCWGRNLVGQLGTGDRSFQSHPSPPRLDGPVAAVSTHHAATCALVEGRVWCWGHALHGQDWISSDWGDAVDVPTMITGIEDAEAIAVGSLFGCALRGDGQVWCWGSGEDGQLGDGTTTSRASPAPVVGLAEPVHRLVAGGQFACALAGNPAEVHCWGRMTDDDMLEPTPVAAYDPEAVLDLQGGDRHACILLADGRVQCWGADTYGQLGSEGPASDTPIDVAGLTDAADLAVGVDHACALRVHREVVCWGRNHFGQLGAPGEGQGTPVSVTWTQP